MGIALAIVVCLGAAVYRQLRVATPSPSSGEYVIELTQAPVKPHVELLRVDVDDSLWVHGKRAGVFPGLAKDLNPGGLQFTLPRNWAYRLIREMPVASSSGK